jgi:gliding motility-associated-like protein
MLIALLSFSYTHAQDIELFQQFGGRIDFTMIGNTLNQQENGLFSSCVINTESTTELNLSTDNTVQAAFLYWAGSGTGDFEVQLNNIAITPTRTFEDAQGTNGLPFFSAFTDITEQVLDTGNGSYTLSEFDLTAVIPNYCGNATNFGGWSIIIIYQNDTLPLNQINVYDGLQHVPENITILLDNLNVIDDIGAKIGFLAWEGDAGLSVNESLRINGNLIGNPPLNPVNNAFNGTNSFTGESDLYNMDMDFYDIQNNIDIGDTTASIQLTSGQDYVMINTIITKLNSQLPDATVEIDTYEITNCNERELELDFTVYNNNSTEILPANAAINIYIEGVLIHSLTTTYDIPIDGSEMFFVTLTVPETTTDNFTITILVDEENTVLEISDTNNFDTLEINLPQPPESITIENIEACNIGFEIGNFDLSDTYSFINEYYNSAFEITLYPSESDVEDDTNSINPVLEYQNVSNPQTIFVKVANSTSGCFSISQFQLSVYNCPPTFPEGFSPNGDGTNDELDILGLYDIFTDFKLLIYNRYGNLIFEGDNNTPKWNGRLFNDGKPLPTATYFYTLHLNDSEYKPLNGWVYLRR